MNNGITLIDVSGQPAREQTFWPTVVLRRAIIEAEIERLASIDRPVDGRRAAAVNHPMNTGPVPAFAPGIDVHIVVLKPGEETVPVLRNSSSVDMCIRGSATVSNGGMPFQVEKYDVWNTPSMHPVVYRNDGNDLFVRLSYSNTPLLERLDVHYSSPVEGARQNGDRPSEPHVVQRSARDAAVPIPIGQDGAQLMGYEWLVDIDTIDSKVLHWPWKDVAPHLDQVHNLDLSYTGRHLYVLYNPATERRIGTSHSFFATIAKLPPGKVDKPHRHTSAAINYIMWGHGKSVVNGERIEWEEGDLHFSAPGWSIHNHASREQGFMALTIQDHPLHIAMESLLWQETLKSPITKLGSEQGIETNLTAIGG
ncbi:cupin domain-containing protein [Parapusillimonas granuli]|uniref:Cupin domain-containing protein n=1 Tax=Parapusillimonas granuli TaxID=380911 RepID=A0A853FVI0_9BURK|nr:cupin domain-containing protein [Parapusillimonas granuli]MBB5215315.1 gentisate 1,2-dioxygenase [Parapusillimonas granuli]NYT50014.1 cupin domain-containing protein [Parapusillimonas granuli]